VIVNTTVPNAMTAKVGPRKKSGFCDSGETMITGMRRQRPAEWSSSTMIAGQRDNSGSTRSRQNS
jgi:hypothetical protein